MTDIDLTLGIQGPAGPPGPPGSDASEIQGLSVTATAPSGVQYLRWNPATSAIEWALTDYLKRTPISASYTALATDELIAVVSMSAQVTISLPSAASLPGKRFLFQDESDNASLYGIVIGSVGTINTDGGGMAIYSTGAIWRRLRF